MKKQRGSSLLLVMIITASILVVVFGTQRLALVQFSQSARDEDNQVAYYAAKAGIEDGLLRYRYNRNSETITTDNKDNQWVNVSTGVAESAQYTDSTQPDVNPSQEYYSIKMTYRSPKLESKTVAKDSSVELTGFPDTTREYYLHYSIVFERGNTSSSPCYAQLQQVRSITGGSTSTYESVRALPESASNPTYDSRDNNLHIRTGVVSGESIENTVRIRAVGCGITFSAQTVWHSSGIDLANVDFDSLTTTITSTGYYGAAKRTLVATIDRISGTLLDVYDMTLYGGTGRVGTN